MNRQLDQYFTDPQLAAYCCVLLHNCLNNFPYDNGIVFIEPSAGKGSFVDAVINEFPNSYITAMDLNPKHKLVYQCDFFEYNFVAHDHNLPIVVIGNPPFGHCCNLAIKFFNHAAQFADVIAFIVPRSFRKPSMRNQLDLHFHKICDYDLGRDGYIDQNGKKYNKSYNIWQVWHRKNYLRTVEFCIDNPFIEFCAKTKATLGIRRTGSNAGKCVLNWTSTDGNMLWARPKDGIVAEDVVKLLDKMRTQDIILTGTVKSVSKLDINLYLGSVVND